MVKIMATPDPRQESRCMDDRGQGWQLDGFGGEGGLRHALADEDFPMDPLICIFWCAVALGALARGSPIEKVRILIGSASEDAEELGRSRVALALEALGRNVSEARVDGFNRRTVATSWIPLLGGRLGCV